MDVRGVPIYSSALSTVLKGYFRGMEVAIKILPFTITSGQSKAAAERMLSAELSVLANLRSPRIVTLVGICYEFEYNTGSVTNVGFGVITEYMSRGSLHDVLHGQVAGTAPLDMSCRMRIALDFAEGVTFLHASKAVHCDLKSANILVDDSWRAKISDFGLSKFRQGSITHITSANIGTPAWTAPEVLQGEPNRPSSDVYSLGVVMWELMTLAEPWKDIKPMVVMNLVCNQNRRLEVPDTLPVPMRDLLLNCFDEPANRPTASAVCDALREIWTTAKHEEEGYAQAQA